MAKKTIEANPQFKTNLTISNAVDEIAVLTKQKKGIEDSLDVLKTKLKLWLKKEYFKANEDTIFVNNIFDVVGRSHVIQVDFINKYRLDAQRFLDLASLLGKEAHDYFSQNNVFVVIPPAKYSTLKLTAFQSDLEKLARKYGVKVESQQVFTVADDFHEDRHSAFTPTENIAIDKVLPVEVQVTV